MARRRSTRSARTASRGATRAYRRYRRTTKRVETYRLRELSENVIDELVEAIIARLGLSTLELSKDEFKQLLKPIIEGIVSSSEEGVTKDYILSVIVNSSEYLYRMVAGWILEHRERLTPEQLEFVVAYGGPLVAANASRLYTLAKEMGREDLIQMLRSAWEAYGKPTPIPCPRCGFRAVTPDLQCIVCGYELSDRELRKVTDFEERLYEAAKSWSTLEVREAFERGYVYLGYEVKPPSAPRDPLDVEIVLSREEREMLRKILEKKQGA